MAPMTMPAMAPADRAAVEAGDALGVFGELEDWERGEGVVVREEAVGLLVEVEVVAGEGDVDVDDADVDDDDDNVADDNDEDDDDENVDQLVAKIIVTVLSGPESLTVSLPVLQSQESSPAQQN